MNIFGFKIKRNDEPLLSFTPKLDDEGAVVVNEGGIYGTYVDLDGTIRTEAELVNRYRDMAQYPELDYAIDDITNEVITQEPEVPTVELILDDLEQPEKVKNTVLEEFENILQLIEFNSIAYEIFRRWYIDGRLYYHAIIDNDDPSKGILELRYIDPRKIRKVKPVSRKRVGTGLNSTTIAIDSEEYYIYNESGFGMTRTPGVNPEQTVAAGIKISKDSIVHCTSGLSSINGDLVLGYLHKAIKPLNVLKAMEDALVIYRISRAPERRIFYVDVGNLPKHKAEQYLKDQMNRFKNKLVYNADTGEIRNNYRHQTMLEDFWLARRDGQRGTEITTLPGGCFAMDTKVSLLDGRELSIREIEKEMEAGKTLWTYSCDPNTGKVVPGLISWAGVTQKSAKVMKLTLDNGEEIICTPDHKFPVWGKGFVEAKDLILNESMIPLYREKKFISDHKKLDYERFFDNESKEWVYTHRMVANKLKDKEVHYHVYNEDYSNGSYDVRHHIDMNRFNNDPSNLCFMSWHDHSKLHQDRGFPPMMGTIAAAAKLQYMKENEPEEYKRYCDELDERTKEWWGSLTEEEYKNVCSNISTGILDYFNSDKFTEEKRKYRQEYGRKNLLKGSKRLHKNLEDPLFNMWFRKRQSEGWTEEAKQEASKRAIYFNEVFWNGENGVKRRENHKLTQQIVYDHEMLKYIIDLVKDKTSHQFTLNDVCNALNKSPKMLKLLIELNKDKSVPNWNTQIGYTINMVSKKLIPSFGFEGWVDFRKKESIHNHRIKSIEYLPDEIEVGTLTIDAEEKYHNHHTFALSCGIFTKNSHLNDIEDVRYFQNKLYRSLNVPISRLEADSQFTFGRASEITRDEVKFAKFINRLRGKFSVLFLKILERQLILKNIITPDEWAEFKENIRFKYAQDNYYAELKESEMLRDRMSILRDVDEYQGKYFSAEWIRRHVLRQTDDDIKEIDKEIKAELDNPQYNPPEEVGPDQEQSQEEPHDPQSLEN